MLLVTSNLPNRLLYLCFIGTMLPEDFQGAREDVARQLAGLPASFRYLVDLSHLEVMGLECTTELGHLMDLISQAGVGLVVRVIPDPSRDIGMNILTVFHYSQAVQVVTSPNLAEAVKVLGLSKGA